MSVDKAQRRGTWDDVGSSDFVFFFNDTATTEIYTLSLHDALPICTCTYALTIIVNYKILVLGR